MASRGSWGSLTDVMGREFGPGSARRRNSGVLQANAMHSRGGRDARPVGGLPPARLAIVSLVAALYLIFALSVPGAFLIAKQVSLLTSGELTQQAENHPAAHPQKGSGEDGSADQLPGPKRLRGALPSRDAGAKILVSSLIASLASPSILIDDAHQGRKPVFVEPVSTKDNAFPNKLLGRSPPE
jgi:hypothetical protein